MGTGNIELLANICRIAQDNRSSRADITGINETSASMPSRHKQIRDGRRYQLGGWYSNFCIKETWTNESIRQTEFNNPFFDLMMRRHWIMRHPK